MVLEEAPSAKKLRSGLNRLAGSNYDKEAWTTVITRLATRASAGLDDDSSEDDDSKALVEKASGKFQFEQRGPGNAMEVRYGGLPVSGLPVAITWLNEEWYNDRIQKQSWEQQRDGVIRPQAKAALREMDVKGFGWDCAVPGRER